MKTLSDNLEERDYVNLKFKKTVKEMVGRLRGEILENTYYSLPSAKIYLFSTITSHFTWEALHCK